jgi:hypothetical protein
MAIRQQKQEPRSPLKATQWRKRGFIIPKDSDGAYRVYGRKDGQDVTTGNVQTELKEARNG